MYWITASNIWFIVVWRDGIIPLLDLLYNGIVLSGQVLWLNFFGFLLLDYDEKAEDAVDYEDIDEQYEGPEIQIASEEDYLLPKKEYFAAEVSLGALKPTASPFDDENYDEDEELEKEHEEVDKETEDTTTSLSGLLYLI